MALKDKTGQIVKRGDIIQFELEHLNYIARYLAVQSSTFNELIFIKIISDDNKVLDITSGLGAWNEEAITIL